MTIISPKMRVQWRKLRRLRRRRHWLPGSQTCPKPFPNRASRVWLPPPWGGSTTIRSVLDATATPCTRHCRRPTHPSSGPPLRLLFVRCASRTTPTYRRRAAVAAGVVPPRATAAFVACRPRRRKSRERRLCLPRGRSRDRPPPTPSRRGRTTPRRAGNTGECDFQALFNATAETLANMLQHCCSNF